MLEALEGDPLPHKASGVDRKFFPEGMLENSLQRPNVTINLTH